MGSMMSAPKASPPATPAGHTHPKRQLFGPKTPKGKDGPPKAPKERETAAAAKASSGSWLDSLIKMPAIAVFIGGGGSAGSGSAFAAKQSAVKSGAYIGRTNTFQFSAELVNYDAQEKEVYLSLDFEYVQGRAPGLLDVGMGALSVDDCFAAQAGVGQFVPPGDRARTYVGSEWTVVEDGYFVNFTPHLHDGGVGVRVYVNGRFFFCSFMAFFS
jgi:hypothetical protein